jgi:uncharacterized coiled-coil protein SlyX
MTGDDPEGPVQERAREEAAAAVAQIRRELETIKARMKALDARLKQLEHGDQ